MKYFLPPLLLLSLACGCNPHKDQSILTGEQAIGQVDAEIQELTSVAKGEAKSDPTDSAELLRLANNMTASNAQAKKALADADATITKQQGEIESKTTTALLPWIVIFIGVIAIGAFLIVWGKVGSALADGVCVAGIVGAASCLFIMVAEPAMEEFAKIVLIGSGVIVVALLGYVVYTRRKTLAELGSSLSPVAMQSLSAATQAVLGAAVKPKALPASITISPPSAPIAQGVQP